MNIIIYDLKHEENMIKTSLHRNLNVAKYYQDKPTLSNRIYCFAHSNILP